MNLKKHLKQVSVGVGKLLSLLVDVYRYTLSGMLGGRCRFIPSCSLYAKEAFSEFGAVDGAKLTFRRLCKCHPWGPFGFDPIPESAMTSIEEQNK